MFPAQRPRRSAGSVAERLCLDPAFMTHPLFDRRGVLLSGLGLGLSAPWAAAQTSSAPFRAYPFTLGVAAGDPASDGFVIWTRLAPNPLVHDGDMPPMDVEVGWEVASDPAFRRIVQKGRGVARAALAHSVHVEVAGLSPHTPYWYRFLAGGLSSPTGRARTLPPLGAAIDQVRLASVGCQDYERGFYTAYRHLADEPDLDVVFHYGDYIYELAPREHGVVRRHWGGETMTLADYRLRYAQYKLDPDLQAAHAAAAFIMSFDDHEIDDNWAGPHGKDGGATQAFAARKALALQAWYEHAPVRASVRPDLAGARTFRRFDFGSLLRMHVLDTRSHRSRQECEGGEMTALERAACKPAYDASRTMLGAEQEAWLDAGLGHNFGWNFIAQQVMMMPYDARKDGDATPKRSTDNWNGYPQARLKVIDAIRRNGLTNVVIGSGDMHQNVVGHVPLNPDDPMSAPVASEFLATSISSGGTGGARHPNELKVLDNNPNVQLLNNQRGYHLYTVSRTRWAADIKALDQVDTPAGRLTTLERFLVDPQDPRPWKA